MSGVDPRIDAYIAEAPPFAQPILSHLRTMLHRACPGVVESIKWGRPGFTQDGRLLAMLGAFKEHASFGLWGMDAATGKEREASGHFGRLASVADLPSEEELVRLIRASATAREEEKPKPKKAPRPALPVPEELTAAIAGSAAAQAVWEGFSATQRRDYAEWVGEAKRPETRGARVAQSVEWIAEGKPRHWKYQG